MMAMANQATFYAYGLVLGSVFTSWCIYKVTHPGEKK
jgi:hypothetical protein